MTFNDEKQNRERIIHQRASLRREGAILDRYRDDEDQIRMQSTADNDRNRIQSVDAAPQLVRGTEGAGTTPRRAIISVTCNYFRKTRRRDRARYRA